MIYIENIFFNIMYMRTEVRSVNIYSNFFLSIQILNNFRFAPYMCIDSIDDRLYLIFLPLDFFGLKFAEKIFVSRNAVADDYGA